LLPSCTLASGSSLAGLSRSLKPQQLILTLFNGTLNSLSYSHCCLPGCRRLPKVCQKICQPKFVWTGATADGGWELTADGKISAIAVALGFLLSLPTLGMRSATMARAALLALAAGAWAATVFDYWRGMSSAPAPAPPAASAIIRENPPAKPPGGG
jgi:hypothetical protein